MKRFNLYIQYLRDVSRHIVEGSLSELNSETMELILDGQPSREIRKAIPIKELRDGGIFFTSKLLSSKLIESLIPDIEQGNTFLDPTCGVGDLLISIAEHLPITDSLESTINLWGERLFGFDIYEEFVEVTKLRLMLLAIHRGAKPSGNLNLEQSLNGIRKADWLDFEDYLPTDNIVLNPPYSKMIVPQSCNWASGMINSAAFFMEKCLTVLREGAKLSTILPDVLRSGANYQKWRKHIENHTQIKSLSIYGKFDKLTDVDVFIMHLTAGTELLDNEKDPWLQGTRSQRDNDKVIGDLFEVHVGSVVPHRDALKGKNRLYISAKNISPWEKINVVSGRRRFKGKTFTPPFVVIRRTSGPREKYRAIASIVVGTESIAVENHLIVAIPKNGGIKECHKLLRLLNKKSTNNFLNNRIRCRHLTIGAVKDIPWIKESQLG